MTRERLFQRLRAAFPAAVTPMDAGGEVDHAGLAANLDQWSGLGLGGALLLGSTGEQVHLSEWERSLVLEVGRRHIPPEQVLIAGTGLAGTRLTIEETKRAWAAGADAALVVTPSYYQRAMTAAALAAHYQAVAEASPIPILLYSVPGITGVTLPAEAVAELAAHPNIVGMKNSGSDATLAAAYRAAADGQPFVILAGSAHAAPGFGLAGLADGVILAAANVLPERSVALVKAAQRGDIPATRAEGERLRQVSETVGRYGIAGWKAAVEARGGHGGPARAPLRNLFDAERTRIAEAVAALV